MSLRLSVAKTFKHVPKLSVPHSLLPEPQLSQEHCEFFHKNGYIVFENFLNDSLIDPLLSRFGPVFEGKFDTGVYPDEWYGGRNMCFPHITREICNVWKSDLRMAQIALSSQIHCLASQLMNYGAISSNECNYGSRIAQDDMLWKPKEYGTSLGFHQDCTYISDQFEFIPERLQSAQLHDTTNNTCTRRKPVKSVTVWLPLDDVSVQNGTLEYVQGSHKWAANTFDMEIEDFGFHDTASTGATGSEGSGRSAAAKMDTNKHRNDLIAMIEENGGSADIGNDCYEFVSVEVPRGGVAIHHENMWHGSGMNVHADRERRVLVVHTLNNMCEFDDERVQNGKVGYIYGKYPMFDGEKEQFVSQLNESYFPVCYGGHQSKRSRWLENFVKDVDVLA